MAWGLVLTSSWTWCIGLFLPVLLVRLFGWTGFWLFAIPNVIGCTAFGWIVTGDRGARLARRLRNGIVAFALWTIAFQAFFLVRLFVDPSMDVGLHGLGLAAVVVVIGFALWRGSRHEPSAAAWISRAAAGAALGILAWSASRESFFVDSLPEPILGHAAAYGAGPFIALGFLACPLLDPTFHWVRARSRSAAPFAWFGLFFASTLGVTGSMAATGTWHLVPLLGAWVVFQLLFTLILNARCLESMDTATPPAGVRRLAMAACVVGSSVAVIAWCVPQGVGLFTSSFDVTYLVFLGAYSTLFPAWVLLGGPGRGAWIMGSTVVAGGLAIPGIFDGKTLDLTLATIAIVLTPLVLRRLRTR